MSNQKPLDMKPARPVGPVRIAIAALLLAFGALLASIGHSCTGLGRRWANEATLRTWSRAVRSFLNVQGNKQAAGWERRLLGIGPSMITSIFRALTVLWRLLLVGGALVWLVINGYGAFVLLGTVVLGAAIGSKRASLKQQMPQHEQLN